MKPCRKKGPAEKSWTAIVPLLALAAAAAAAGGLATREPARAVPAARLVGIAPIYRQMSFHGGEHDSAAEPVPSSGGSMSRPVMALLRIEDHRPGEEFESMPAVSIPASASRRRADARASQARRPHPIAASPAESRAFTLVFNGSFASLFANLFDARDAARSADAREDRNPFTEAKEKETERTGRVEPAAEAEKAQAEAAAPPRAHAPDRDENAALAGQPDAEDVFLFLGDFDGSGVLGALEARRTGENEFDFGGIPRSFRLLVSPAAVEDQRSLGIEDIDGDGVMDMVVTSRASLFGGVLLGDADGGFRGAGFFLTGYEPTAATFGSVTEEGREILSVNLRTGMVTTFRRRGGYTQYRAGRLDAPPDWVAHVVELASGLDYLLAGRDGMQPRLYRMTADSRCEPMSEMLPDAPGIDLSPESRHGGGVRRLRVYQVGSYASVVLSDSGGRTFNVANLRVAPGLFLVFGNLERRGSLDVGVALPASQAPGR